jgi:hypothetical protein
MADNTTKANLIAKILFVAGGIILFIVLVIFIFKLVPSAISGISNLGSSITSGIRSTVSGNDIEVTTNTDVIDVTTPLIVSFEYDSEVSGQYFVTYNCVDGLFFDIQSKDGPKRIVCNVPLKLGSNLNSISLTPAFTEADGFADSIITIEYRDAEDETIASGSKTVTVKGKEGSTVAGKNPYDVNGSLSGSTISTSTITTPRSTIPTYTAPTYATTYTAPTYTYVNPTRDLVLTHIAPTNTDSTFVIHVYNYGNTPTGPWDFKYTDAENPSRTLTSPLQGTLGAGQGLAVTVRFDGQDNERQTISVVVDPSNKISETNESNNTGSTVITGDESNDNGDNSYDSNDDADLIITDMAVGRMSGNNFDEDDEIEDDDTAAVQFTVKNQGGESTGSWRFEIDNLPYDDDDNYRSGTYSSLRPGESIEITVEFDGIDEGRYSLKVDVDSDDDVDEESESNNDESETLEVNN